ncbi:hypothetical protein Tco_0671762 [Tanacetum coccineum]
MGYYFYFPPENKLVVARYAEFFEKNLITQEVSGRAMDLKEIQDEDTPSSKITSKIPMDVEGFEPPQEEVILNSESTKWIDAMNEEKQSILDNMVWVLVDLPPGYKTVGSIRVVDPNHPKKVYNFQDPYIVLKQHQEAGKKDLMQKIKRSSELHWTAVKNILKYLRNTKDMFLVYGGNPKAELRVDCYCNAGFKTDIDE